MPAVSKKSPNPPLNVPMVDASGKTHPIWQSFIDHFHSKTVADLQAQVTSLQETIDGLSAEVKRNGISASSTIPTKVLTQTNNGTGVTVTMAQHIRRYDDETQATVNETSVDLPYETIAGFYYIDVDREGGDVELLWSTDLKITRHNYVVGQHSLGPIETMAATVNDETGWETGTAAAAGSWSNPERAATPNDSYASQSIAAATTSANPLIANDFGFAVPVGATITGIGVRVKRYSNGLAIEDVLVRLRKAGVLAGDDKADIGVSWPTSNTLKSYGGEGELWGEAWTAADVNDAGFGVEFNCKNVEATPFTAYVDSIEINVFYTETASEPQTGGGTPPPGWPSDGRFDVEP